MAEKITIGAINTDWSTRKPAVATPSALQKDIAKRVAELGAHVLSASEVSSAKLADKVVQRLFDDHGAREFGFVHDKIGYDRIVQFFDEEVYERIDDIPHSVSTIGKYMGVHYTHLATNEKHLHVSVHLPHKKGRGAAKLALARYIEDKMAEVDAVFVSGDFNDSAANIGPVLTGMKLAVTGATSTTAAATQKDNIAAWEECELTDVVLQADAPYSHFPLACTAALPEE